MGVVVSVEAVEVEVEGVEAGSEVAAGFLVPGEGCAVVAEVAGEGGEVVRGVGGPRLCLENKVGNLLGQLNSLLRGFDVGFLVGFGWIA